MQALDAEAVDALARAAAALSAERDVDHLLAVVCQAARDVTGAPYAALGVIGKGQRLARFIHSGLDDETVERIGPLPTGRGVLGVLVRDPRQALRLDDVSQHPASSGFPPNHPHMGSFLGVPIRSGGSVYGNLYLTHKPGGFNETDEHLVGVLAAQAGAALASMRLMEQLSSFAVQEERERISRDLHDRSIQSLFAVGMALEGALRRVHDDPVRVAAGIDLAIDQIDAVIADLRSTIHGLQDPTDSPTGIRDALIRLARDHEAATGQRPSLDVTADLDDHVQGELAIDAVHIVREALSNVARHGNAMAVAVVARIEGAAVLLRIVDDGVGFDPSAASAGRGLDNLKERAATRHGSLTIDTGEDSGTIISASLPLHDRSKP